MNMSRIKNWIIVACIICIMAFISLFIHKMVVKNDKQFENTERPLVNEELSLPTSIDEEDDIMRRIEDYCEGITGGPGPYGKIVPQNSN